MHSHNTDNSRLTALACTRGHDALRTAEKSTAEGPRGIWIAHSKMKGGLPPRKPLKKKCVCYSHVCRFSALSSPRCWRVSSGIRPPGESAKGSTRLRDFSGHVEGPAGDLPSISDTHTHTEKDYCQLVYFHNVIFVFRKLELSLMLSVWVLYSIMVLGGRLSTRRSVSRIRAVVAWSLAVLFHMEMMSS